MEIKDIKDALDSRLERGVNDNNTVALSVYYLAEILKEKRFVFNQPIRIQNDELYNI